MPKEPLDSIKLLQDCSMTGIGNATFLLVKSSMKEVEKFVAGTRFDLRDPVMRQARTLLSEYYEYLGRYDRAERVLSTYLPAYEKAARSDHSRHPRLCLWCGNILYRRRLFVDAEALIQEAVDRYSDRGDDFGRGFARFYQGRLSNRSNAGDKTRAIAREAIADFQLALPKAAAFRVGICRVLLGWVAFWEDNWLAAEQELTQASELFAKPVDDPVHLGRVHFIRGCIARASAVSPVEFESTIASFQESIKLFRFADHRPYLAGALNQLGLTYTQRWEEADRTEALKKFAEADRCRHKDARTAFETSYFRSRYWLRAGDVERAERSATEILESSDIKNDRLNSLRAEILVAKSRAQLVRRDRLAAAVRRSPPNPPTELDKIDREMEVDLQEARGLVVGRRRRTEVACWLVQSELECRRHPHDLTIAEASLAKARQTMGALRHRVLEAWADEVQSRIVWLRGGFLLGPLQSLNYEHAFAHLRVWLVKAALRRARERFDDPSSSRREVARLLGIKRQVLERWLADWRELNAANDDDGGDPNRVTDQPAREEIADALRSRKRR